MTNGEPMSGQAPANGTHTAGEGGQAPTEQQQQQHTQQQPTTQQPQAGAEHDGLTAEQLKAELTKVRREAAQHRTKLKEFEDAQAAAEAAKLSETERLQRQYADLQAQLKTETTRAQERIVRAEVRAAAGEAGIKPQLAARLIDYAEIEFDADSGDPTNIGALLKKLVTDYPELAARPAAEPPQAPAPSPAPRPSAGATASPPRSATNAGAGLTRDAIAAMSPQEHQVRRAEVMEWLRTHPNG